MRQVLVVDLQGHGRTADIDRPFSFDGMADDVAGLITHFGMGPADVMGYSAAVWRSGRECDIRIP